MHRRPIIGISTQTQEAIPGKLPRVWIMGHTYIRSLTTMGGLPWVIPLIADDLSTLRAIYDQLDGVFMPGGVDVDPGQYGETKSEMCGRVDPDRDGVELMLTRWALADHKPFLGVCRGVQVLNVAAGGTLYQDVLQQMPGAIKHDYWPYDGVFPRTHLAHEVQIESKSRLGRVLKQSHLKVNSMHHQGIRSLAPGLVPTAYAPDGLIESVEMPNGQFAIGVQWHPEEFVTTDPVTRRLFAAFIDAANEYRASHPALSPQFVPARSF